MKLKTFLTTGINKRIDAHRHVCSVLGLDTEGKAEALRNTLVAFAHENPERDAKVRSLVTKFVENEEDTENGSSQTPLFTQLQNKSICESDSGDEDENADKEDELPISSTPSHTKVSQNIPNALTSKIKSWMMGNDPIRKETLDANLNESIQVIEKSFAALSMADTPDAPTGTPAIAQSQHTHPPESESENQPPPPSQTHHTTPSKSESLPKPPCCDFDFMTVESRKIIASKDGLKYVVLTV